MSRLRVIYMLSVLLLGTLTVLAVFRPVASDARYSEVQQAELMRLDKEWILQFNIINHEGRDINYTVKTSVAGIPGVQTITVGDGRFVSYRQHIRPEDLSGGQLSFAVYKESENAPFEQATYHLKPEGKG